MAEKCINQHKRLAQGEEFRKYAKGGMVQPRGKQPGCGCKMKCGGSAKKGVKK